MKTQAAAVNIQKQVETARRTEPDFDNPKCLCGIPGCEWHEDKGGFIEIPWLAWQLLFEREESWRRL